MIKPIETHYRGYRFRSRLEARHAVLFDSLDIPFEYEKEGYDLGDGIYYLPDFWLPEQQCWVEVKADEPDDTALEKARRLAVNTGSPVYLMFGQPELPDATVTSAWRVPSTVGGTPHTRSFIAILTKLGIVFRHNDEGQLEYDDSTGIVDDDLAGFIKENGWLISRHLTHGVTTPRPGYRERWFWLTECGYCHKVEFSWFGDMRALSCGCMFPKWTPRQLTPGFPNFTSPRLVAAYETARQARFEFNG